MASPIETVPSSSLSPSWTRIQRRHSIAALVYFLYGMFYLLGAQYLTNMQMTQRGMSGSSAFFIIGAAIAIIFPILIYSRFALALSLWWKPRAQRKTLFISFTLILGLLVIARVAALLRGGLYAKTWLHTAALLVAAINAVCLIWAGLSQPAWITRTTEGDVSP